MKQLKVEGYENEKSIGGRNRNQSERINVQNRIGVLVVPAILSGLTTAAAAQNTNAVAQNFFQSAQGYRASFNTNEAWASNKLEFAVGADYQNRIQWAGDLELQYDVNSN